MLSTIIAGLAVILVAGVIQGLTGFGFALVSVPILIIFLSPKVVVPLIIALSMVTNIGILLESWKLVQIKRIWPMMLAALAGLPLGTYLLIVLDANALRILIGATIIPFALAFLAGFKKEIKNEKYAFAPLGLLSGLLNASTTLAGPPIILFFINQGVAKAVFRANLAAYFMVLSLFTIVGFIIGGIITNEVITLFVWFIPAAIVGTIGGIRLAHRINEKLFRNAALVIVIMAGIISIVTGLGLLSR